jgi:hypothetical protein
MGKLAFLESDAQACCRVRHFEFFDQPRGMALSSGESTRMVVLEVATSTPKRAALSPSYSILLATTRRITPSTSRRPRSIISSEALKEITYPRLERAMDLMEQLWQFCHATSGLCAHAW